MNLCCPAPHGAGGLKFLFSTTMVVGLRPAPHGAGGLKSVSAGRKDFFDTSCPTRGRWIEIDRTTSRNWNPMRSCPTRGRWIEIWAGECWIDCSVCPAPHGAGGLKYFSLRADSRGERPAPHGAGGLKYFIFGKKGAGKCPAPHGAGGLKCRSITLTEPTGGPAPHGAGGLKLLLLRRLVTCLLVLPHTGQVD